MKAILIGMMRSIESAFPSVIAKFSSLSWNSERGVYTSTVDVYFVRQEDYESFSELAFEHYESLLEEHGVDCSIIHHFEEETREYYPEIVEERRDRAKKTLWRRVPTRAYSAAGAMAAAALTISLPFQYPKLAAQYQGWLLGSDEIWQRIKQEHIVFSHKWQAASEEYSQFFCVNSRVKMTPSIGSDTPWGLSQGRENKHWAIYPASGT